MSALQNRVYSVIDGFSEDKLLKLLSYATFLKDEEEGELYLSSEEESELEEILRTEERTSLSDAMESWGISL